MGTAFKVLNGVRSCDDDLSSFENYLPKDGKPGNWLPKLEPVIFGECGYYLTSEPQFYNGDRVFLCEYEDSAEYIEYDELGISFAVSTFRFISEITLENCIDPAIFIRLAPLAGIDLSGLKLKYASFSGKNLRKINLSKSDLCNAFFVGSNLEYSDLSHAYLIESSFRESNLKGANLRGAFLVNATFKSATLDHADLRYVDLREADLSGAHLNGANLEGADLRNADLSGAFLLGANLRRANLRDAIVLNADMHDANIEETFLTGVGPFGGDYYSVEFNLRLLNERGARI
jgi:uncharacterized protein YjbI with pentapeptide repeats